MAMAAAASSSSHFSTRTFSIQRSSPRLASVRSYGIRLPVFSSTTRLTLSRHHRRFFVVQRAAQTEVKELNKQQDTNVSDSDYESSDEDTVESGEENASLSVEAMLNRFREAVSNNDETALAELESKFQLLESERATLAKQVANLNEEAASAKDHLLRLNADFENFRKRSERDRIAVSSNVKGDVVNSLLPMVDNFERAKAQIKIETDGEQRIDSSYQGIYKQFVEIMKGLGVSAVETVGKEFDPNIHEAIMREESTDYPEGVVMEEFRRGFMLGDKLLRPAMVKVSSGPPAPAAPDPAGTGTESEPAEEVAE